VFEEAEGGWFVFFFGLVLERNLRGVAAIAKLSPHRHTQLGWLEYVY